MEKKLETWCFGGDKKTADRLFELVKTGRKTATCSLYLGEEISKNIGYSILTNFDQTQKLKIKTKKAYVTKFCDVTSAHAKMEGEGNLSLAYWRKIHKKFFKKECKKNKIKFCEDIEILCEEFQVAE